MFYISYVKEILISSGLSLRSKVVRLRQGQSMLAEAGRAMPAELAPDQHHKWTEALNSQLWKVLDDRDKKLYEISMFPYIPMMYR
jgi:hypothetical protein